jgi:uncharacterized protein YcbK (DUF882 family)
MKFCEVLLTLKVKLDTIFIRMSRSLALVGVLLLAQVAPEIVSSNFAEAAAKKGTTRRGRFAGHGVKADALRTEALPRPSGWVHVSHPGAHLETKVNIYNADGSFNESALAELDSVFRCRRTNEVRAVDPRLYEILSIIYDHFNHAEIQLASGFRYQRNEGSRHFHASAMDIKIVGVPMREVFSFAQTLDRGGMGIGQYPGDGFVHIDFRAPGEPSYRWTDTGSKKGRSGRLPSRMWKKRSEKPNT